MLHKFSLDAKSMAITLTRLGLARCLQIDFYMVVEYCQATSTSDVLLTV